MYYEIYIYKINWLYKLNLNLLYVSNLHYIYKLLYLEEIIEIIYNYYMKTRRFRNICRMKIILFKNQG